MSNPLGGLWIFKPDAVFHWDIEVDSTWREALEEEVPEAWEELLTLAEQKIAETRMRHHSA